VGRGAGIGAGCWSRLRRGLALLALAAGPAFPALAEASPTRPAPPSAAEFERATDALLRGRTLRGGAIGPMPAPEPSQDLPLLTGDNLAVALYGAPQLEATAVGKRTPAGAARKLRRQAREYRRRSDRPVVRNLNLIGVIATASRGSDGRYRARQPDKIIRTYLEAARSVGARLTLDIQPGRSSVIAELRALRAWLELPDVDVGIDPEWHVGRRGVPGRSQGSISARKLNQASRWIDDLVSEEGLPPKAMIVHQFHSRSVVGRKRVRTRDGADVVLNFDGIGARRAKRVGYADLTNERLLAGFSLFDDRDIDLKQPRGVLRLDPAVDFVMYQ
jgi:hypothetical protein